MAFLTRDDFMLPRGHKTEIVKIAEWDDAQIGIKTLTANERLKFEKLMAKGIDKMDQNYQVYLVALCAVGEDGIRLFSGEDDLSQLEMQPAYIISFLFNKAAELNALGAKPTEEVVKNSEPTAKDASSSG